MSRVIERGSIAKYYQYSKGAPEMEHGMLDKVVPAAVPIANSQPERWITQIQNGVVTLVQRIEADAFVVRAQDLSMLVANEEIVSDPLAKEILLAIGKRKAIRYGSVELDITAKHIG